MATFCPRFLPLWAALLASATAVAADAPPAAAAAPPLEVTTPASGQQPITLTAASSEVDIPTNTVVLSQVTISQGNTRVQADHARATGLNFGNSRWTFEGKVRIEAEEHGNLRSDEAIVEFRDNHIARATVTGKPAEFEQKRAGSEQLARGHADEIVYDVSEGTVRFSNDAWLSDGQREISGALLVYNVRAQRIQAEGPVRIVIAPPTAPDKGEPAAKPPGGQPKEAPATAPPPQS